MLGRFGPVGLTMLGRVDALKANARRSAGSGHIRSVAVQNAGLPLPRIGSQAPRMDRHLQEERLRDLTLPRQRHPVRGPGGYADHTGRVRSAAGCPEALNPGAENGARQEVTDGHRDDRGVGLRGAAPAQADKEGARASQHCGKQSGPISDHGSYRLKARICHV